MPRSAAALIIGNEILSGKIREGNLQVLAREMRLLGIELRRVIFCPDDEAIIARDLTELRTSHDLVFTSGGVGPTHDDVTLPAVARSFGRPLVRSPLIEGLIRGYWDERVTDGHLRMADVPEGSELLSDIEVPWPVITVDNVMVLPGVPKIFASKLHLLRDKIGADTPFLSRALYTRCDEGAIAALLARVSAQFSGVEIGSYPRLRGAKYRVKLTFDGLDAADIDGALEACRREIGEDDILDDAAVAEAEVG